ncbi:MAG TPA: phosphoribosylanthranilate isomerase [Candidatus Acidoferrales bacterium]
MVKVKICGITNWADAKAAVEGGANLLGFNFYRKSPRYIAPAAAARIIRRLPAKVQAVGVFVNEPEVSILATARRAGLHVLQLHGDESPALVESLSAEFPVIKALRVRGSLRASQLRRFGKAEALLLDGFDGKQYGGTGKSFDWRLVQRAGVKTKIFLAGGLTAENVREAIATANPYAVDACSGVEARPGKKDLRRMAAFLRAAKSRERPGVAGGMKRKRDPKKTKAGKRK